MNSLVEMQYYELQSFVGTICKAIPSCSHKYRNKHISQTDTCIIYGTILNVLRFELGAGRESNVQYNNT